MYRKCIFCGWGRKQVNDIVKFYAVPSTPGRQRMSWMHVLAEEDKCKNGLRASDSVCSVHFYKGKPVSDPSHPDFVPHLYLKKNSVPHEIMKKSLRYMGPVEKETRPPRRRAKQPVMSIKERAMTPAQRARRRAKLAEVAAKAEVKAEPVDEELEEEEEEEAPSTSKANEEKLNKYEAKKAVRRILDHSRPLKVVSCTIPLRRVKEVKKDVKQEEPDSPKLETTDVKVVRTVVKSQRLRRPPLVLIRSPPKLPPPPEIFTFDEGTVDNEVIIDGDTVTVTYK